MSGIIFTPGLQQKAHGDGVSRVSAAQVHSDRLKQLQRVSLVAIDEARKLKAKCGHYINHTCCNCRF